MTQTYRHTITAALKNWHSLAAGATLLGFSAFLTSSASASLKLTQTAFQGWVMLIVAGYAFVSAIFLSASPLSENRTLTETVPGIFDNFKSFIIGGLFFAIGTFFLTVEVANISAPDQALALAIALFAGAALTLVAVLVAVEAAFFKPKKND